MSENYLVLAAAGLGLRLNEPVPKALVKVKNKPIFIRSLDVLLSSTKWSKIVIAVPKGWSKEFETSLEKFYSGIDASLVIGGETRQESVYRCLEFLEGEGVRANANVIIHDAARCLVSKETILSVLEKLKEVNAVTVVSKVVDTVVKINCGVVKEVVDREQLGNVQTPQAFKFGIILKAHKKARKEKVVFTDDATLVSWIGEDVYVVYGNRWNLKVTEKEDLRLLHTLLIANSD
ncbi:MAG: 2-C-methyl-D-erythritol 4-phosphate cytidylyltransferase [Candidatus Dadabacteria bacterium]|nr:MAG: 2-C-methyl-D-erythritol 4-phosphate cytidylyltransferase [Candidatus Dadabacteria bacterium]